MVSSFIITIGQVRSNSLSRGGVLKSKKETWGLYISLPCFPPATEHQQERCQRNADLRHFGSKNTGTTYSDHREYDKRLRSLQIYIEIYHMDHGGPKPNEMRELYYGRLKGPKQKTKPSAAIRTNLHNQGIRPHLPIL